MHRSRNEDTTNILTTAKNNQTIASVCDQNKFIIAVHKLLFTKQYYRIILHIKIKSQTGIL